MSPSSPSVQLYTVRDALQADLGGTIARLAELGFTTVEPFGLADFADALAGPLAEHGLAAPTAHASLVGGDLDAVRAAAERLGTRLVIEPAVLDERWATRDAVARVADDLNAAAERFAADGLEVGYHNHWWELEQQIDGRPALLVVAEYTDPRIRFEVDTYWAAVGGADPVAVLTELGDRVAAIHVKDGPVSRDTSLQQPAGHGAMPLAAVLAAAPQALRVLEFDAYAGDLFDGLAAGLATLAALEGAA